MKFQVIKNIEVSKSMIDMTVAGEVEGETRDEALARARKQFPEFPACRLYQPTAPNVGTGTTFARRSYPSR